MNLIRIRKEAVRIIIETLMKGELVNLNGVKLLKTHVNAPIDYLFRKSIANNTSESIEVGINALTQSLINTKDSSLIKWYIKTNRYAVDVDALTKEVIKLCDANGILLFATGVEDVPTDELCDAICKTDDVHCMLHFARNVEGADIKRIEQRVIEVGDIKYMYQFAKYIKDSNKINLINAICDSADEYKALYLYCIAKDITDGEIFVDNKTEIITKLTSCICAESGKVAAEYIYKFAKDIPGVCSYMLAEAIKNISENVEMVQKKPSNDLTIEDFIIQFATDVPNIPIKVLTEAIVNTNDFVAMLDFAIKVPNADLDIIIDAIAKMEDSNHLLWQFAESVEKCPLEKVINYIIK